VGGTGREGGGSDGDLDWFYDGPNSEDKVAEQRAILASFELLKQTDDDTHACEEANDEQWCRTVDISIQRGPIEEAGCRFFAEERHRLLEDAAKRRSLFAGLRRMRRLQEWRREGGDDTGLSSVRRTAGRIG
jgi:hypothetical protein